MGHRWTGHYSSDSDYQREPTSNGRQRNERGTIRSRISRDSDASPIGGRSSREEERRKVLEIEEERQRREREVQLRRGIASAQVGRSGSRVGMMKRNPGIVSTDQESQYSGNSSSGAIRKGHYDQPRVVKVKRTSSNANSSVGGANGVRRDFNRRKVPASVTSSLNSTESENTQNGNRSVYLHSACVVDIPLNDKPKRPPPRALSAERRESLPNNQPPTANLQRSKKLSRSISFLGPFKPKPTPKRPVEIHYDNSGAYVNKPPRPPSRINVQPARPDNKSASSINLLVQPNEPEVNLSERQTGGNNQSNNPNSRVSRSVSMPKDTRLAGWFKRKKKN